MNKRPYQLILRSCATRQGEVPLIVHAPCLNIDPQRSLLLVPPLFEEMNRSRALLAALGRELASRGIVTLLPDLPGTGDCPRALENLGWNDWMAALKSLVAIEKPARLFAMRGGALLASGLDMPRDDFAPLHSGALIWRTLARTHILMAQETGQRLNQDGLEKQSAQGQTLICAGYALSSAMLEGLRNAHIVRAAEHIWQLGMDDLEGPPVWLQAEPLAAEHLAQQLAERILQSWP